MQVHPAAPGVAAEARRGCAPVSSHGEWHFHQWCGGAVGLFAFDTKHERLYNGGACLIGADQWAALDAALDAPGLRCVYVASDTPFVDRSFADAAALAAQDAHFSHTWPARGDELMRSVPVSHFAAFRDSRLILHTDCFSGWRTGRPADSGACSC